MGDLLQKASVVLEEDGIELGISQSLNFLLVNRGQSLGEGIFLSYYIRTIIKRKVHDTSFDIKCLSF